MEIEEKVWDAFTDLAEWEMADMAERACGWQVFRKKMLDEVLSWHADKEEKARIIMEAEDGMDFSRNDAWMIYDEDGGVLVSSDDLMELLSDYQDEIVDAIMADDDLMDELGVESEEEE